MKIDYSKLRTGDIVSIASFTLFGAIIRKITGRKRRFFKGRKTTATHTAIVVTFGGQKLIAEMTSKGLQLNSLEKYVGKRRRKIVEVSRSTELDKKGREEIRKKISLDLRKGLEYDWAGDIAFLSKRVKENPKKFFCSEYASYLLKFYGGVNITENKSKVSPDDLAVVSSSVPSLKRIDFIL